MSEKRTKIFISHSSLDLPFVQPLTELLARMGIKPEQMICSSVTGYNIPLGKNILDYLQEQFRQYNIWVIFLLSDNYYNSPVALNEMGAAWVLRNKYTSILVPSFSFRDIKGAIDPMQTAIKLDSNKAELKARLTELWTEICSEFRLSITPASLSIWERDRDEFIDRINSANAAEVYWERIRQLRKDERHVSELISPLKKVTEINPADCEATYMLGTVYLNLNDLKEAKKCFKLVEVRSKDVELQVKACEKLKTIEYLLQ